MMSQNMIGIASGEAFTVILIYKRTESSVLGPYLHILNFGEHDDYEDDYTICYPTSGSNSLSMGWTTTGRSLGAVPSGTTQLVTIDNNNGGTNGTATNGINWYLSGEYKGSASTTSGGSANTAGSGNDSINFKIIMGSSHWEDRINSSGDGSRSFTGDIQELIILKRNRTSYPFMTSTDLNKIHSYLAVKYGISLNGSDNYVNSDGTAVWNKTANNGYNNHIFGIARDDAYGLYQKQSRSASLPFFTAFVGNNVMPLNSGNTSGRLNNGVYAMFGSNGGNTITLLTDLSDQYTASGSTEKLNYRNNLTYKVQITGASSLTVKLKPVENISVPEYMLISANPAFPNDATTEVIPFRDAVVEKELQNGVYISFAGHTTSSGHGPGGVGGSNLRLWLRADDEASLTTELLPSGSGKLQDYPDATAGDIVPAVSEWKDLVRGQTYSYAMGGGATTGHLEPVYQQSNYMTNFHPALRYWGNGTSRSTWLGNTATNVFDVNRPVKHSAFFVVNNNFGTTHNWIYTMMFGSATLGSWNGPGYGMQKLSSSSAVVGRFRTNSTEGAGAVNLFKPDATSILGYHHWWPNGTSNPSNVKFRFNGLEDQISGILNGDIGLQQASMIGPGYDDDRVIYGVISEVIMYENELPQASINLIESYLALKYGITINDTVSTKRFDYKFSDGTMLWNGKASGTEWATYYNRVAAVIRDDASNLYNRQSHSTNVGSILHMGVAGTRLGKNVDVESFDYDTEAVIWGDDAATGVTQIAVPDDCGDFEHIFNRKWLIHKKTENDRPIRMLVGAENNSGNQLGQNATDELNLYNKLTSGYDVSLIIADSPEKLTPGHPDYGQFTAVIPMQYLDDEHQCSYTFSNEITYVTFGYKENRAGCAGEVEFEGAKTFDWTQWTRTNYGSAFGIRTQGARDLGDGVQVTGTTIEYQNGVGVPAWYPSVTGSPVAGSLYLQRQNGALNSEVTVTIEFNTPVSPEFSIYDIDGYQNRHEKITITGECGGGSVSPDLSYAGAPGSASYIISGNTAKASISHDVSLSSKNGQLNVAFREGVKKIVIVYSIVDNPPLSSPLFNRLVITPIKLRRIPPLPLINEDGLSFAKDVAEREITTCDPAVYSFYIRNVNCNAKYVNLRDTLPAGMKWQAGIGIGAAKPLDMTHIDFNSYEGVDTLRIDSVLVPGSDVLRLTLTARLDKNAVPPEGKRFNNHAWLEYDQIVRSIPLPRKQQSVDRETLANETWFDAIWTEPLDSVKSSISIDRDHYVEDCEITVTVTLDNRAMTPITDSYLDFRFDAGFTYVNSSFSSSITGAPVPVVTSPLIDSTLSIAGSADGSTGFTIPAEGATFSFKLKAPSHANLVYTSGGDVAPLSIDYEFTSLTSDPCVLRSITDLSGLIQTPYKYLVAYDDYVTTIPGATIKIAILENDSIPGSCQPLTPVITKSPASGVASIVPTNDSILYAPGNSGSNDTLTYSITCNGETSQANVYITIQDYPGDVVNENCFTEPPAMAWGIKTEWSSGGGVSFRNIPFVGDLDDDEIPEIVCFGTAGQGGLTDNLGGGATLATILVYDGSSKDLKTQITLPSPVSGWDAAAYGLVKLPDRTGLIVVACVDLKLRAYDITTYPGTPGNPGTGNLVWTSDYDYSSDPMDFAVNVGFADFNGDGHPEIYVRNKIYDAASGKLLKTASGGNNTGSAWSHLSNRTSGRKLSSPIAADVIGDACPELILGNEIYSVVLSPDRSKIGVDTIVNSVTRAPGAMGRVTPPAGVAEDGHAQVADFNKDGRPDIFISNRDGTAAAGTVSGYVWDVHNGKISAPFNIPCDFSGKSIPLIADVDNDGALEIVIQSGVAGSADKIRCYKYNPVTMTFSLLWEIAPDEDSFSNSMTLFDFNQDGMNEVLITDQKEVRIFNGSGKSHITHNDTVAVYQMAAMAFTETTIMQYPIIADVDNDGSAEIVACGTNELSETILRTFESAYSNNPWAPARKVWNQYMYNVVNVNEDLTIPPYQFNPATVFPGADGIVGSADDVRPYNNFLQQQTKLNIKGTPLWLTPDAHPKSHSSDVISGNNSIIVTIHIENLGAAAIKSPVYVTLYGDTVKSSRILATNFINREINSGETDELDIIIPDITQLPPFVNVIARVNDNGTTFPYQIECDTANNKITLINTLLSQYMEKNATVRITPPVSDKGIYENPVSILYNETIKYEITVINPVANPDIVIRDTLPPYLRYKSGTANPSTPSGVFSITTHGTNPVQDVLTWSIGINHSASDTVSFEATTVSGVNASQPLYFNQAWVLLDNTINVPTNYTYHQGAGTSIVTFSAGYGGNIYNADPQVIDYSTSAGTGILVAPDEGYHFVGWSHDDYTSHRGKSIKAQSGIMHYDTLVIFGNVELRANFEPERYPIRYYLNGSVNDESNPVAYTVESAPLTLAAPLKEGDVFVGWTGTNGEEPQAIVTIPKGLTGEVAYYANFLYSGREDIVPEKTKADRIWSAGNEAYIYTSRPGSIVRIFTPNGVLRRQHTILSEGLTKLKLEPGIYIVALNNGAGQKIIIGQSF
jgi:uncharacterized repeat protein (TIGR02543 family)